MRPTHIYNDNGLYTATLRVTDEHGDIGIDTCNVEVKNVAPTASIDDIVQPNSEYIFPNDLIQFNGSFYDPGLLDTHTIEWDFGDGNIIIGDLTTTHSYASSGKYNVTLRITDDDGEVGMDVMEITVEDRRTPEDLTMELIDKVEDMNLPRGLENALVSKLRNALKSLEKDNYQAAINQLSAFQSLVNAQMGKKIPEDGVNDLLNSSEGIINGISDEM